MSSSLRAELEVQEELLSIAEELLKDFPHDQDALAEMEAAVAAITSLQAQIAASNSSYTTTIAPAAATSTTTEENIAVGDTVLARWSEDKAFYPASVISKTGSKDAPVFTVKFKSYGNIETVRGQDIKTTNQSGSKKRKAEDLPSNGGAYNTPPPPPPPTPFLGKKDNVISAPPAIDTSLAQKKEPSLVSDGPTRLKPLPKKLKNSKALDKAKSKWNDWQKEGPKQAAALGLPKQKESQFRLQDKPGSRVGFTSGSAAFEGVAKKPAVSHAGDKEV